MTTYLCITIRFADPAFHGRGDGGAPEWPPSPLRVFQALVAASAARIGNQDRFRDSAVPAFEWLAGLQPPTIVAPAGITGTPFRTAVPNNDLDIVARSWARRVEPDRQPAALKTLKTVRPTHIVGGGEFPAVHYLWEIADADKAGCETHKELVFTAARDTVALGWGIDLVGGEGSLISEKDVEKLPGEAWRPTTEPTACRLRVPATGTVEALVARHQEFLHRLDGGGFTPVPSLSAFATVGYRRTTDVSPRPVAAFEIWKSVAELAELPAGRSKFRPFDVVRWTPRVAGMVRHAVAAAAERAGWTTERINTFVHGHTPGGEAPARGDDAGRRFSYIPLPSLEQRGERGAHVGMIRRVLIVGPPGATEELAWVRRALSGQELLLVAERNRGPVAMLSVIPQTDRSVQPYLRPSVVWSTVTPVVLPGHDDRNRLRRKMNDVKNAANRRRWHEQLDTRVEGLLRTAIVQAGFPTTLAECAELSWRLVGFRPGLDLANRYQVPDHLQGRPRYHVRICWRDASGQPVNVCGPGVIGAGRHCGLGLFAAEESP